MNTAKLTGARAAKKKKKKLNPKHDLEQKKTKTKHTGNRK